LVQATRTVTLTPLTASEALGHGAEGLAAFGRAALTCIAADMAAAEEEAELRLDRLQELESELSTQVYGELAGVVHEGSAQVASTEERALLAACRLVGDAARCGVVEPARGARPACGDHPGVGIAHPGGRTRDRLVAPRRRAAAGERCGGRAAPGPAAPPAGPLRNDRSASRHAHARRSFRGSHARASGACLLPTAPCTAARRPRPAALRP